MLLNELNRGRIETITVHIKTSNFGCLLLTRNQVHWIPKLAIFETKDSQQNVLLQLIRDAKIEPTRLAPELFNQFKARTESLEPVREDEPTVQPRCPSVLPKKDLRRGPL